jgi:hypothetical protein
MKLPKLTFVDVCFVLYGILLVGIVLAYFALLLPNPVLELQISRIRKGMTKEQVRNILGEPDARTFERTWVYTQKDCFIDFEEDKTTVMVVHRFGL